MRKFINFVFASAIALMTFAGCAKEDNRENILKIYNWADYIDEDVLTEFKDWYKEQTGEDVTIIYQLFDINEIMLAKIERGHEDFDVVCPSDYIIERMLRNDLLLPIDRDFGDTPNYIDGNLSPYIVDCFNKIDGHGKNANDYSVGYMWGTTGILYNTKYVTEEEASTWSILQNEKFGGKIFVKDAFRDVYGPILVYLKQDEIASGKVTLDETSDVSYFFGEGADSVKIDRVQYPSAEVIARCAMMHDSGDRTEQMLEMWSRVKGDNINTGIIIICACALIGLLALAFARRSKRSKKRRSKR